MAIRPNLLFVMSDDHAAHAISAYGSLINSTPQLDRIATGGMRFDVCCCTNSICTPSRAAILTGTYNHVNGVTTLDTPMDNSLHTFPRLLHAAGYQTALYGKWHLGHGSRHDPVGFDDWRILPGQGHYHDPAMLGPGGEVIERAGYVTDLITEDCLAWLDCRDPDRPFALFCHHKAPHRRWECDVAHLGLFAGVDVAEPCSLFDDNATRSDVVRHVRMGLDELRPELDLKGPLPAGLTPDEETRWRYQHEMTNVIDDAGNAAIVIAMRDRLARLQAELGDTRYPGA